MRFLCYKVQVMEGKLQLVCFLLVQITFDRVKKINKLKPYTRYVFIVGIGNYYSQHEGKDPVTGDPAIYRTAPGSNIF